MQAVITKFVAATSLSFKRKTICDRSGRLRRWWFIIHGSEVDLLSLESKWDLVKLHTNWKLERCHKPFTQYPINNSQHRGMDKESVDNDSVDIIQVNSEEEPHSLPAISLSETTLATATTPFLEQ